MKELRSTHRAHVQRIEGYTGAPNFVIDDCLYFTHDMQESYITSGEDGAHHTLDALVVRDQHDMKCFNLHIDYHKNLFTLTPVEEV